MKPNAVTLWVGLVIKAVLPAFVKYLTRLQARKTKQHYDHLRVLNRMH